MAAVYRLPFNNAFGTWKGAGNWDDPSGNGHSVGQPFAWDVVYDMGADPNRVHGQIYAARAGTVIDMRNNINKSIDYSDAKLGPGNYVIIRHADNTIFAYDHMKHNSVLVSIGQYVEQGTHLGVVGNTGSTSGTVHLHMEAHTWWDPKVTGDPSDDVGGGSLLIHFEDGSHKEPWRPLSTDTFVANPLQYRQDGWRFCYQCAGLFFSYQGADGVCPNGGGPHKSQGGNYTLSDDVNAPGQPNWKYCFKCKGLFFAGNPGSRCPVTTPTDAHDGSKSNNYHLINNAPNDPGQHEWRYCNKCKGLWFASASKSKCPKDNGAHSKSGSGNYSLALSLEDTQRDWRYCNKCHGLYFKPNGDGKCPAGGSHSSTSSGNYVLCMDVSPINAMGPKQSSVPPNATGWQGGWRYCSKCGVLFMGTNQASSKCPASSSGKHAASGGTYWVLINNSVNGNGLGQVGWRWCANCQGLWFAAVSGSHCPAGPNKAHIKSGSGKYILQS